MKNADQYVSDIQKSLQTARKTYSLKWWKAWQNTR